MIEILSKRRWRLFSRLISWGLVGTIIAILGLWLPQRPVLEHQKESRNVGEMLLINVGQGTARLDEDSNCVRAIAGVNHICELGLVSNQNDGVFTVIHPGESLMFFVGWLPSGEPRDVGPATCTCEIKYRDTFGIKSTLKTEVR